MIFMGIYYKKKFYTKIAYLKRKKKCITIFIRWFFYFNRKHGSASLPQLHFYHNHD